MVQPTGNAVRRRLPLVLSDLSTGRHFLVLIPFWDGHKGVMWVEGGVSYSATDLEKKAAFYQIRAAESRTKQDKQYWLRISRYWRNLQRAARDEDDDQVN